MKNLPFQPRIPFAFFLLVGMLLPTWSVSAQILSFAGSAATYNNNFFQQTNTSGVWSSTAGSPGTSGEVTTTAGFGTTSIYDTAVTPGTGTTGGTLGSASPTNNAYTNPTLTLDFSFGDVAANTNQVRLYFNMGSGGTTGAGYVLLVNTTGSGDDFNFRMFTATNYNTGSQVANSTTTSTATAGDEYSLTLAVTGTSFVVSVNDVTTSTLNVASWASAANSIVAAASPGAVGFGFVGTTGLEPNVYELDILPVPEPSSWTFLVLCSGLLLAPWVRRRLVHA